MIIKNIARASLEQVRIRDNRALATAGLLLADREMCLPLAEGGREPRVQREPTGLPNFSRP
jgi:hypothetical protein